MLAGDEPSLAVAGIAVGMVRGLAKDADRAGFFLPLHDAVVRDVAPQEVAAVTEPHRALGPTKPGRQPLDGSAERRLDLIEARIERLDRGIGVALSWLPSARPDRRGRTDDR